jgi:demethylmenaquinone methyltransferase/2-methoxy-6-polyprenyl-1,4-benzoquinol methylase
MKDRDNSGSKTEGVGSNSISGMFDEIAGRYDLLNRLLSMNLDRGWRRRLVKLSGVSTGSLVIDVCAGTCDISVEFARTGRCGGVVGVDFSTEMLKIGRQKIERGGYQNKIELTRGDAEKLPFKSETFDVATMGFGLRNLTNYKRGISEMARVVKKGGRVLILEFAPPRATSLKLLYRFYLSKIIPTFGTILTGKRSAYKYLSTSVSGFLEPPAVLEIMRREGLKDLKALPLTFGVAYIYSGEK